MLANRWGQAKREVAALWPLISSRLSEGITTRQIWLELRADGRVTVALRNFYAQIEALSNPNSKSTKAAGRDLAAPRVVPAPVPTASPKPEQGDLLANDLKRTFTHSRRPDADELW